MAMAQEIAAFAEEDEIIPFEGAQLEKSLQPSSIMQHACKQAAWYKRVPRPLIFCTIFHAYAKGYGWVQVSIMSNITVGLRRFANFVITYAVFANLCILYIYIV